MGSSLGFEGLGRTLVEREARVEGQHVGRHGNEGEGVVRGAWAELQLHLEALLALHRHPTHSYRGRISGPCLKYEVTLGLVLRTEYYIKHGIMWDLRAKFIPQSST